MHHYGCVFFLSGASQSNDETNGYGSNDDCESVTSMASSVDSYFPLDDTTEG